MPKKQQTVPLRRGEKIAGATTYSNCVIVITDRGRIMKLWPDRRAVDEVLAWHVHECEVTR